MQNYSVPGCLAITAFAAPGSRCASNLLSLRLNMAETDAYKSECGKIGPLTACIPGK